MVVFVVVTLVQSATVPKELLFALQNRAFADRGDIAWTVRTADSTVFYRTRFAADERINESEVVGDPRQSATELHKNGDFWIIRDGAPVTCRISDFPDRGLPDARAVGFNPSPSWPMGTLETIIQDPLSWGRDSLSSKTYKVADDGSYKVVTTRITPEGGNPSIIKQWLDPNRGMNVVKSQLFNGGQLQSEAITLLAQYGEGRWFPSITNVYHGDKNDPVFTITVDSAVFDDPSLPGSFGPEDIGVEIGTNIHRKGAPLLAWDGDKLAPFTEVAKRVQRGELQQGPNVTVHMAKLRSRAQVRRLADKKSDTKNRPRRLNETLGAWERYVLQFIRFYGLDAGQHNKAISIFATVKERAGAYLNRKQKGIESLEQKMADLGAVPDTTDKTKMLNQLADERVALEKPLLDLFNNALKPRLHSLLTRKQKARGELP